MRAASEVTVVVLWAMLLAGCASTIAEAPREPEPPAGTWAGYWVIEEPWQRDYAMLRLDAEAELALSGLGSARLAAVSADRVGDGWRIELASATGGAAAEISIDADGRRLTGSFRLTVDSETHAGRIDLVRTASAGGA